MKKFFLLIVILSTLTGCWNYRELNQLAITTGIAIDKKDDKFVISLMIANSKKQNSSNNEAQASTAIYTGEGITFYEAIKDAALAVSKQVYLGHIEVLVLSEEIAENNIIEITDFLFRYPQTRNQFYLVISEDIDAKDVFEITMPLESFPSQNISKNLEITERLQGYTYKVTFNQFISTMIAEGISPTLPTVRVIGSVEEGNKEENIKQNKPDAYLKLGMIALFKKDKLVAISNKEESSGINIINNHVQTLGIQIECDNGHIVSEATSSKADVKIDLNAGIPKVIIDVDIHASIQEVSCKIDLEENENIKMIKQKDEEKIKEYILSAINLAKENKTDVFGFGNKIYKQDFKYWYQIQKNWEDEIFPKVEIEVNPKVTLTDKGAMNTIIEVNE